MVRRQRAVVGDGARDRLGQGDARLLQGVVFEVPVVARLDAQGHVVHERAVAVVVRHAALVAHGAPDRHAGDFAEALAERDGRQLVRAAVAVVEVRVARGLQGAVDVDLEPAPKRARASGFQIARTVPQRSTQPASWSARVGADIDPMGLDVCGDVFEALAPSDQLQCGHFGMRAGRAVGACAVIAQGDAGRGHDAKSDLVFRGPFGMRDG